MLEVWTILMGMIFADKKKEIMETINNSSSKKYIDYVFSDKLIYALTGSEGMEIKAYPDYTGVYTIGKGSTYIVSDNGKILSKVYPNMTLQAVAKQYFNIILATTTQLNEFANRLAKNHLKSVSNYPVMARRLDAYKTPFHEDLAIALHDFGYQSGSGFTKTYSELTFFLTNVNLRIKENKTLAFMYGNMRNQYLKKYATSAYNGGVFGIRKRIFKHCWLIKYGYFPQKEVESKYGAKKTTSGMQKLSNDFFTEFGIIV